LGIFPATALETAVLLSEATPSELALGMENESGSASGVTCQVHIEKVLERNTRRSRERKEKARAIWAENVEGRIVGVMMFGPLFCSSSGGGVVEVENDDIWNINNVFSWDPCFKDDI
jgi:hypothetical protein